MDAVDLVKRLHQHRAWVNGNLLNAAAQLSDEQLRSQYQIGQRSIWKSLVHLYAAEYVWLEALCEHLNFLGVPILEGPVARTGAVGQLRSVYFRDPDGNLVDFYTPRTARQ